MLFLAYTFYVGFAATTAFAKNTWNASQQKLSFEAYRDLIDEQYSSMLDMKKDTPLLQSKSSYIDLNGQMASLLRQQTSNARLKLSNGHLVMYDSKFNRKDIIANAENVASFCRQAQDLGKNFLFVMAPSQCYAPSEMLPAGYTENINSNADLFLEILQQNNVPWLDLRQSMERDNISLTDAFFVTDHHWTVETGFWAYAELLRSLEDKSMIPALPSDLTDPDNFDFIRYEDCFLGSSGKRTGRFFAGVDDFTVIVPKFDTEISVKVESKNVDNTGRFENVYTNQMLTSLDIKLKNADLFNDDPYSRIGYGNSDLTHWRNSHAPLNAKFMLIGDSIASIPFALLPLSVSSCDELDMRSFGGDFPTYFQSYNPDIIIVFVNAYGLAGGQAANVSYNFSIN